MPSAPRYGPPADVYSFAVLALECLTSCPPYSRDELRGFYREMKGGREAVPSELDAAAVRRALVFAARQRRRPNAAPAEAACKGAGPLLETCWELDPARRPDARELCRRVARLFAGLTFGAFAGQHDEFVDTTDVQMTPALVGLSDGKYV